MGAGGSKSNPERYGLWTPSAYQKAPPKDITIHWKQTGFNYPLPDIPDYKKYKVEGNPIIEKYQQRLAREGLTDPWIRNHAWKIPHPKDSHFVFFIKRVFLGKAMAFGAGGAILTIVIDETFGVREKLKARGW